MEKLGEIINEKFNRTFKEIFEKRYDKYYKELLIEQSEKNKQFQDPSNIIDILRVKDNFKEKLLPYIKNELFKIFFCIIIKLFMTNIKDILLTNIKKEIEQNENLKKIIHQKAEIALKNITENLKQKLISELDNFMRQKNNNEL